MCNVTLHCSTYQLQQEISLTAFKSGTSKKLLFGVKLKNTKTTCSDAAKAHNFSLMMVEEI
jgi:hypothetical protein